MADLVFVVIVVAFFAVCVAFVKGCDLIIGPDPEVSPTADADVGAAAGSQAPGSGGAG